MSSRLRNVLVGAAIGLSVLAASAAAFAYRLYRAGEREYVLRHLTPRTAASEILRLEVVDTNGVLLWSIVNANATTTEPIDYGSLPPGFSQLFPRDGHPRQLVSHEHLLVSYTTHLGWARVNIWQRPGNRFRFGIATSGQPPLPDSEMFVLGRRPR
jgi:hypothetical protein